MLQEGVGSGTGPSVAAVRALVNHHLGPGIVMDTTQAIAHIRVPSHLESSMPALLSALKVCCLFNSQISVFRQNSQLLISYLQKIHLCQRCTAVASLHSEIFNFAMV